MLPAASVSPLTPLRITRTHHAALQGTPQPCQCPVAGPPCGFLEHPRPFPGRVQAT